MTMTAQDRKWMLAPERAQARASLTQNEMLVLDRVFRELYNGCKYFDMPAAEDDRAASLEAALVRFFIESREA
jgi:hypothetical protein